MQNFQVQPYTSIGNTLFSNSIILSNHKVANALEYLKKYLVIVEEEDLYGLSSRRFTLEPYKTKQLFSQQNIMLHFDRLHNYSYQHKKIVVQNDQYEKDRINVLIDQQKLLLRFCLLFQAIVQWPISNLIIQNPMSKYRGVFDFKTKSLGTQLMRSLQKIKFRNLRQLSLKNLQITNIQCLIYMSLPKLRLLNLSSNKITSIKPLNKIRRFYDSTNNNSSYLTREQYITIDLQNNPIGQYSLTRIQYQKHQIYQNLINGRLGLYDNKIQAQKDLSFLIKSQYSNLQSFSTILRSISYLQIDNQQNQKQQRYILINKKLNNIIENMDKNKYQLENQEQQQQNQNQNISQSQNKYEPIVLQNFNQQD